MKKMEEEKARQAEEERLNFYKKRTYKGIPVPTKKQENKDKFGTGNREEVLDEWEKNMVKRLFRAEFDKDKQGIQTKDELKRLMIKLLADECNIGKIPDLSEEDVNTLIEGWPAFTRLTWFDFRDNSLNGLKWSWRL